MKRICLFFALTLVAVPFSTGSVSAQEKSVKPGINDSFQDPKVEEYVGKFEIESREVFAKREKVLAACKVQPGMSVADVGAGTGIYTRLFSEAVGDKGQVIAVDIAKNFLEHISEEAREKNRKNIQTLLCSPESTKLPSASVDLVYICDTYHHFEFPQKTLASIHAGLKPGGRLIVIDFKRVEGKSSAWTMNHVRAGQEVFEKEITDAGFEKIGEKIDLLDENYFIEFRKAAK